MPEGTTTALVGETGSGKTTLGYLAARLYDVGRGAVTIGGVDVRDLSFKALTDLVGVVSQETYLFHASVRENLRFAKPDATDAEIEAAAEAARIHHVLAALPDGYDTMVGERGYRFSGGEKQRMAIARTILRNPPILVLDEATSSLDTETERLVQEALDRLSAGRTTIAIAHRLSTVRDAEQIVVLDRGRVVEIGRHEELLAAGGRYAALVSRDADLAPPLAAGGDGRRLRVRSRRFIAPRTVLPGRPRREYARGNAPPPRARPGSRPRPRVRRARRREDADPRPALALREHPLPRGSGPPALLICSLGHADYGAALQRRCLGPDGMGVDWHGFSLAATGRGRLLCSGGILWSPATQRPVYTTVPYGGAWHAGPFTCRSRTTGVTCTNRAGHGLFLARASWRVW